MTDAEADKYVDQMVKGDEWSTATKGEVKRWLRILVKEVERDTRHKCCELVNKLSIDIHNLRH